MAGDKQDAGTDKDTSTATGAGVGTAYTFHALVEGVPCDVTVTVKGPAPSSYHERLATVEKKVKADRGRGEPPPSLRHLLS